MLLHFFIIQTLKYITTTQYKELTYSLRIILIVLIVSYI